MSNDARKLTTYEKILEAALKKEKASYRFYDYHAKNAKVRVLWEIFEELREEEAKHVKKIQNMLDEIR